MAKQPPTTGEPAKQVAIDVLRKAGGPLIAPAQYIRKP
jgi:hypothetical protein